MQTHLESAFTIQTKVNWSHVIDWIINLDIVVPIRIDIVVLLFEQHSKPVKFVFTCLGGLLEVEKEHDVALVGNVLDEICGLEGVWDDEGLGIVEDDALGLWEAVDHGLDAGDAGEFVWIL